MRDDELVMDSVMGETFTFDLDCAKETAVTRLLSR